MQAALQATQTYLAALASALSAWSAAAAQAATARDDRIQAAQRTYAQRLQDLQSQAADAWQDYESALLDPGCVPGQSTVPGLVAHTLPAGPGSPRRTESGGSVVDRVQTALDVGGCLPLPLVAEGCDVINAGISLARGDYLGAGLSLLSVIPLYGDAAGKGGKLARRAAQVAENVPARQAANQAGNAARIAGGPFPGFPDWGRTSVQWGVGAEGAKVRAAKITAQEAKALDREKVKATKAFYESIYIESLKGRNPNAAAKARAELMDRILELQETH